MGKFETLQRLFESQEFNDTAAIVISIEDGQLGITPFGGSFHGLDDFDGIEVFGLTQYLVDQAMAYGGTEEDSNSRPKTVTQGDKH